MKSLAYILRRDKLYDSYASPLGKGIWLRCYRCKLKGKLSSSYTDDKEVFIFCSRGCAERHEQEARKQ